MSILKGGGLKEVRAVLLLLVCFFVFTMACSSGPRLTEEEVQQLMFAYLEDSDNYGSLLSAARDAAEKSKSPFILTWIPSENAWQVYPDAIRHGPNSAAVFYFPRAFYTWKVYERTLVIEPDLGKKWR